MKDIFIVVPTLDPDIKVMDCFIKELHKEFKNILVINDGSDHKYDVYFQKLEKNGIEVFYHHKNFGKGRAIKNAFNYLLNKYPNLVGCVTSDSDGQHTVKDIKKCVNLLLKNTDKLVIGVRNFEKDDIPLRSRFGNIVTRTIFKSFVGLEITDTQTGLRGFSRKIMELFSDVSGERYEFETNMLILAKKLGIKIKEFEIDTIYIDSNSSSHFNPIKDSIRIYRMFTKYFLISFSSYLLDIILFSIFLGILKMDYEILASTILARIISSIYNYSMNSKIKFKDIKQNLLVKYYILTLIQMFISGCAVTFFYKLTGLNIILLKIVVDTVIWIIDIFIESNISLKGKE